MKKTEQDGVQLWHDLMERKHWRDEGPWESEPDRAQWVTKAGFHGLALRGPMGSWCGYVAVPAGHPWHGKDYQDEALADVEVHGGLTFAETCQGRVEKASQEALAAYARNRHLTSPDHATCKAASICHDVVDEEDAPAWWLGFDTAHYQDLWPFDIWKVSGKPKPPNVVALDKQIEAAEAMEPGIRPRYRTLTYVMSECENLAQQISEAGARD